MSINELKAMSEKTINDLYNKTKLALSEVNNMKLLK